MSMCLTLAVTLLDSKIEMQTVLYSHITVGEPVGFDGYSKHLQITLVFFTSLCMHIIYTSIESEDITGKDINTHHIMKNT